MTSPAPKTDFPIFSRDIREGKRLIYLDSGATAQRPQQVIEAELDMVEHYYGAVNRGSHKLAERSSMAFEDAREKVARFVGADAGEVVWTSGATQSLNLLAYSMSNASIGRGGAQSDVFKIGPGDVIVTTRAEHHANIVPWQELCARTGAQLRWLECDEEGRIDLSTLGVIDERVKLVAFTHASNVTGAISPVKQITEAARAVGAITVLDACQSVAHMPVDVHRLGVDFAAFSSHKMLGPTGVGALYGRRELLEALPPYQFGGSMVEIVQMDITTYAAPPERFEAGTQPVVQAVGMGAAVDYLSNIGMSRIAEHEDELTSRLLRGITDIPGVRVLGPLTAEERTGSVAFILDGVHPHDVGQVLDAQGIAVRTGHHCAQPIHQHFGVFASSRASLGPYNDDGDVDAFLEALSGVRSYFGLGE